MFKYYQEAKVCYAFLDDVTKSGGISKSTLQERQGKPSEWFERGWTLQELLAPHNMRFYDRKWELMGTRSDLAGAITSITGIGSSYLNGQSKLEDASVATKMSWMAGRQTGYVEDTAYSLIGMFKVFMTPQYGEGTNAFARLQEALKKTPAFHESLFA